MNGSWKTFRKQLMAQPGFKEGYNQLKKDPEFAIYDALDMANKANITQAEIAKRMGTKQSAIARLRSEDSNPSIRFLDRFAKAIGMRLEIRFRPL